MKKTLSLMLKLGRKSVSVNFEFVSILEAKNHIKELFEYSLDSLYKKHKK